MAVRSGRAVPPRLLEPPPEVHMGLGIYMNAFFDLCSDRREGGRIPWSTIHLWCSANGLAGDDEFDAHFILRRMDMAYVEWARGKGKKMNADAAKKDEAAHANTPRVRR